VADEVTSRRRRRLWWAVVGALAATACGVPGGALAAGSPKQGRFAGRIDIGGGRELYLRCAGRGRPTVMMDSGIHDSSDPWTLTQTMYPVPSSPSVFEGVARFTHVCVYDRPGTIRYTSPPSLTMRSTPVSMPRTVQGEASDVHRLLMAAGLRAPVVIVAHSMAGLTDRYFASKYRREVRGMVLVDAFAPAVKRLMGRFWPRYDDLLNVPGTPLETEAGWETLNIDGAIRAVQHARPLAKMPLAVISKTEQFALPPSIPKDLAERLLHAWPLAQNTLVGLEPQTPHILATGSDHYVQIRDPDLTTSVVGLIVGRVRDLGRRQRRAVLDTRTAPRPADTRSASAHSSRGAA
jgi:pimeloyl-ACP methyl ester carboxylesterase